MRNRWKIEECAIKRALIDPVASSVSGEYSILVRLPSPTNVVVAVLSMLRF